VFTDNPTIAIAQFRSIGSSISCTFDGTYYNAIGYTFI